MTQCGATYTYPSKIKVQCTKQENHEGRHVSQWKGKEGDYTTYFTDKEKD